MAVYIAAVTRAQGDTKQVAEPTSSPALAEPAVETQGRSVLNAFLDGRGYVVPQDVKDLALDVLRHRVATTYEAEAEEKTSEDIVKTILDNVRVP